MLVFGCTLHPPFFFYQMLTFYGLALIWRDKLLWMNACKSVCDVRSGIDPYPFLTRSWNKWCLVFSQDLTPWKSQHFVGTEDAVRLEQVTGYILNRKNNEILLPRHNAYVRALTGTRDEAVHRPTSVWYPRLPSSRSDSHAGIWKTRRLVVPRDHPVRVPHWIATVLWRYTWRTLCWYLKRWGKHWKYSSLRRRRRGLLIGLLGCLCPVPRGCRFLGSKYAPSWNVTASSIPCVCFAPVETRSSGWDYKFTWSWLESSFKTWNLLHHILLTYRITWRLFRNNNQFWTDHKTDYCIFSPPGLFQLSSFTFVTCRSILSLIFLDLRFSIPGVIEWPTEDESPPEDARDLVTRLLEQDPIARLGTTG